MTKDEQDIVVIGGGAAGLTAAGICASFGARTLLVEKRRLGGDCTWTGCIPSKTLLHAAHAHAAERDTGAPVDFSRLMEHVRAVRRRVYEEADSPEILARRGVAVAFGEAAFAGSRALRIRSEASERTVRFRAAVIATGSTPAVPGIPGLREAGFLTNETLFELNALPRRLAVLGGGPVGVETAQALARLGSEVTLVTRASRLLPRDEPECVEVLQKQLEADGVKLFYNSTFCSVERKPEGLRIGLDPGGDSLVVDAVMVAAGRRPGVAGLELERAGVRSAADGIPVDRRCRTAAGHVFAVGDVTDSLRFTHVAEDMARAAAMNAVLRLPLFRRETGVVPWVTYTDPEVAHVGRSAEELRAAGTAFETLAFPYSRIDRAVTEDATAGMILVHAVPPRFAGLGGGRILGASVAGRHAGEAIVELAVAMKHRIGLPALARTVHPYPTWLLGVRRAADQTLIRRQRPWMSRLVRRLYGYRGEIPAGVGSDEVL